MKYLSAKGLVVLSLLSFLGTANVAHGRVETVFVGGNITTCTDLFAALNAGYGYQFGAYAADGPAAIRSEIRITSVYDGVVATDGVQKVRVYNYDGTSFDWQELDMATGEATGNLLGFDAVARKAGNGRTVTVYIPEGTDDQGLQDHNNNNNITEALFCADTQGEAYEPGLFCSSLNSNELADVCNVLGNDAVFEVKRPTSGTTISTELCACPDVITTGEACDPSPQCTGGNCCLLSPNGNPLVPATTPQGSTEFVGLGSLCMVSSSTSLSSGETTTTKTCFCDPSLEYADAGSCRCNGNTKRPNELAPEYPLNCNSDP